MMQRLKTPLLLFLAAVLTRLPFTSRLLYNIDSVQFVLGTDKLDVALHQPQPPGYYLYVMSGRLFRLFLHNPNTAFVAISILASGLAAIVVYLLGREVFDGETGVAASVLFIASPLMWFHGEVALSYMPEALMSVLIAYICYRMMKGQNALYWLAAVVLAVAGGIRQNTMVFLMPLWFFSMKRLGLRRLILSLFIFGATVLAWFVPMLIETGGYARYSFALRAHWLDANWRGIHLDWIAFNAQYMTYFILSGLLLALAPLLAELLNMFRGRTGLPDRETAAFFAAWLLPPFLFHLIVFTHPAVPGHSLIYVVGLIVLAARALAGASQKLRIGRRSLLAAIASVNAMFFIFAPYPLSARGIRKHDHALRGYINAVRDNFSPSDTEIISGDQMLYSYRQAMYYLPEYRVYSNVLITTPEGPRLFWGQGRRTYKARWIRPLTTTRRYVDFWNYKPEEKAGLPAGTRFINLGNGQSLAYYESLDELYKVSRIKPYLDPALKPK